MSVKTKQVIECDECGRDVPVHEVIRFSAGSIINGTSISCSMDFCPSCLGKKTGSNVTREVVYVERDEPTRGGGATGRPFSSVSRLVKTEDWYIPQRQ